MFYRWHFRTIDNKQQEEEMCSFKCINLKQLKQPKLPKTNLKDQE